MKVGTDSVLLGSWSCVDGVNEALDMGAGSGILSLMVAQRCAQAHITAIEIDPEATDTAQKNFQASSWHQRIEAINADVLEYTPTCAPDLIICNPPYFTKSLLSPDLSRTVARHVSGKFGPVEAICKAAEWLSDTGSIAMITPYDYVDSVVYQAEMLRLKVWRMCSVSTIQDKKPTRMLWQISKNSPLRLEKSSLVIRDREGKYSSQYIELTNDFYLHF